MCEGRGYCPRKRTLRKKGGGRRGRLNWNKERGYFMLWFNQSLKCKGQEIQTGSSNQEAMQTLAESGFSLAWLEIAFEFELEI